MSTWSFLPLSSTPIFPHWQPKEKLKLVKKNTYYEDFHEIGKSKGNEATASLPGLLDELL